MGLLVLLTFCETPLWCLHTGATASRPWTFFPAQETCPAPDGGFIFLAQIPYAALPLPLTLTLALSPTRSPTLNLGPTLTLGPTITLTNPDPNPNANLTRYVPVAWGCVIELLCYSVWLVRSLLNYEYSGHTRSGQGARLVKVRLALVRVRAS